VSEYEIRDSRRLTGANVLWSQPGAVLDIELPDSGAEAALQAWQVEARRLLDAVGWPGEKITWRVFPGGISLALSAPLDALYAATEVNEAAWGAARGRLEGRADSDGPATIERLRKSISDEANPRLLALQKAAGEHHVAFLSDDDQLSIGHGVGSRTWAVDELPAPDSVAWDRVHDIPIGLVTGTNGKTTTVRLLAAMVDAAGLVAGMSSTDWLKVGDDVVDAGDWSGPGGARTILRDSRVEVGLLETARGGMLRRGLGVTDADVAVILNVAEDHLGEWGVEDLAALVEAKFVVTHAGRNLVLNADDPELVRRAPAVERPITWFGLDAANPTLAAALTAGAPVVFLQEGEIHSRFDGRAVTVVRLDEVPIALGGAARHNVANALAAIATAHYLGLPLEAVRQGLRGFRSDPTENPGRLNIFDLGGARVMVDFAHNPHGLEAILEMAAALPAERRLVLIGQAGDRTDTSIRELAGIVWRARPDRIIVKEMKKYLRGRDTGEISGMIEEELHQVGAPNAVVGRAESEMVAARQALEWARDGDLLLMLSHEARDEMLALMVHLERQGWRPGQAVPETPDKPS